MKSLSLFLVLAAIAGGGLAAQGQTPDNAIPTIARDQVKADADAHKATLVEALPPDIFKRSHLPKSLNIPIAKAEQLIPKLLPDKSAEIIVYCMNAH
jgi:rhodanese-related sulfurtransferase